MNRKNMKFSFIHAFKHIQGAYSMFSIKNLLQFIFFGCVDTTLTTLWSTIDATKFIEGSQKAWQQ